MWERAKLNETTTKRRRSNSLTCGKFNMLTATLGNEWQIATERADRSRPGAPRERWFPGFPGGTFPIVRCGVHQVRINNVNVSERVAAVSREETAEGPAENLLFNVS